MIYLDHHAATPLCAAARAAMLETLARDAELGNPSSVHHAGRNARALLERARDQVAAAFGVKPSEVVLTSGGTESCNLAIRGLAARASGPLLVVTTAIEHPAVLRCLEQLERTQGFEVTRLELPAGRPPAPQALAEALADKRAKRARLCAMQWVNHETGNVLPIASYAEVCQRAQVPLFVDAIAGAGKLPLRAEALGADLIAVASHKLGGPAGAGALLVRRPVPLEPLLLGGSQERGLRAGSPDLLALVGFGAACEAISERLAGQDRLARLRDRVEQALLGHGFVINAAGQDAGTRVATVVNASLPGALGAELVAALDLEGVCVSSGSACSSGLPEPSAVLRAMYPEDGARARGALRLSFGPETQETDVDFALCALSAVLSRAPRKNTSGGT